MTDRLGSFITLPPHSRCWWPYIQIWCFMLSTLCITGGAQLICKSQCGNVELAYPFGVQDGCGSRSLRGLLVCLAAGRGSGEQLQLNSTSSALVFDVDLIDYKAYRIIINQSGVDQGDDGCKNVNSTLAGEAAYQLSWVYEGSSTCSSNFSGFGKSDYCTACELNQGACGYNFMSPDVETCLCSTNSTTTGCYAPSPSPLHSQSGGRASGAEPLSIVIVVLLAMLVVAVVGLVILAAWWLHRGPRRGQTSFRFQTPRPRHSGTTLTRPGGPPAPRGDETSVLNRDLYL